MTDLAGDFSFIESKKLYERPSTAFVARFIGGHNVVTTKDGPIAIRADRCRLGANGADPQFAGKTINVEYLGSLVRVQVASETGHEAAALVPDHLFFAAPVSPGQPVTLSWSAADAHALAG